MPECSTHTGLLPTFERTLRHRRSTAVASGANYHASWVAAHPHDHHHHHHQQQQQQQSRIDTGDPSLAWPTARSTTASPRTTRVKTEEERFLERMWRAWVLSDRHVHFYIGCTLTGVATAPPLLFALLVKDESAVGTEINMATGVSVTAMYSTVGFLLILLNQWSLDLRSFHVRHLPLYAIAIMWITFIVLQMLPSMTQEHDGRFGHILFFVSSSFAVCLSILSAVTLLCVVPSRCTQMRFALFVIAVGLLVKAVIVYPKVQVGLADETITSNGYMCLWGSVNVVPLCLAFITVHWQRVGQVKGDVPDRVTMGDWKPTSIGDADFNGDGNNGDTDHRTRSHGTRAEPESSGGEQSSSPQTANGSPAEPVMVKANEASMSSGDATTATQNSSAALISRRPE